MIVNIFVGQTLITSIFKNPSPESHGTICIRCCASKFSKHYSKIKREVSLLCNFTLNLRFNFRRLVRVVERASLESLYTGNRIEGSNPSVSAFVPVPNFRNNSIGGRRRRASQVCKTKKLVTIVTGFFNLITYSLI